ncbi:hypothetical protein [Streptomyces sp. NPDC059215]|uniref:hypothetical protein n=1 Tax=Streptomyces sp. NPDC059215 TaxID=3346772 RepID=UPI0036B8748E
MTLREKRPRPAGPRRTAVAVLALALVGSVTGAGVAFGSDAATAGGGHGHDHTAPGDWLPDTPENWPLVVDRTRTPSETVTRGLRHYSETYDMVSGRQRIQVLQADLTDLNLRIGMGEAGDTLTDPADETPSSMARRTHAVAGVNGDCTRPRDLSFPHGPG